MEIPFDLEFQGTYVHIQFPSATIIGPDEAEQLWETISSLSAQYACRKFLIETSRPDVRFDTMSAFESGSRLADMTSGLTLAFCLYDYEHDDVGYFFKTVVENRGVKIEYFSDLQKAVSWIGESSIVSSNYR